MRALVFDFDGLIIDTESAEYQSFCDLYAQHDVTLPFDLWAGMIGKSTAEITFDPYAYLEEQIGQPLNQEAARTWRRARFDAIFYEMPVLPGVLDTIAEARRIGLKLAVASSGSARWVKGNLERVGLIDQFDTVCCADDVPRAKPDPALYLLATSRLNVEPQQAIALEDSPNGLLAAKRAGLFGVAIPNPLTSGLNFDHADLRLNSLADMPLPALIEKASQRV